MSFERYIARRADTMSAILSRNYELHNMYKPRAAIMDSQF